MHVWRFLMLLTYKTYKDEKSHFVYHYIPAFLYFNVNVKSNSIYEHNNINEQC